MYLSVTDARLHFLRLDPKTWTKAHAIQWIGEACVEYEIEDDVSKLKTLSGAGLTELDRQDWIERSPKQGDLFFNLWTELIQTSQENGTGTVESLLSKSL